MGAHQADFLRAIVDWAAVLHVGAIFSQNRTITDDWDILKILILSLAAALNCSSAR